MKKENGKTNSKAFPYNTEDKKKCKNKDGNEDVANNALIDELQCIKNDISEIKQQITAIGEKLQLFEANASSHPMEDFDLSNSAMRIEDAVNRLLAENTLTTPQAIMALSVKKISTKSKVIKFISNILFYLCMIILLVGAISFAQNQDPEKSIFGYRYYYIKTSSMEPVLPVGSVVFTRDTSPEKIRVGDDITVYLGDDKTQTYLTHRVVEIIEDETTGELLFRTKGVNNKQNDATPFNSKLVVGKVVLCVPVLGTIMLFVQSQLIFVIVIFILILALSFMLRILFTKEQPQEPQNKAVKKEVSKKEEETDKDEIEKEENEKAEKEAILE